MRLTEEVINDIRNSADSVDVIGHYIPLIKQGKGYSALCPFQHIRRPCSHPYGSLPGPFPDL